MESITKPNKENPLLLFVIGSPGAGKGTLCKRLAADYGFTHLSVGDMLRDLVANPDDADDVVRDYVKRGELLPMEHLLPLLKVKIGKCVSGRPILLDGFPRRLDQAWEFEEVVGEPRAVLFFNCPHDLAKQRVLERKVGRAGDTSGVFEKRYKEFLECNPDILDYYNYWSSKGHAKLIEVDTSGGTEVSYRSLIRELSANEVFLDLGESQAQ